MSPRCYSRVTSYILRRTSKTARVQAESPANSSCAASGHGTQHARPHRRCGADQCATGKRNALPVHPPIGRYRHSSRSTGIYRSTNRSVINERKEYTIMGRNNDTFTLVIDRGREEWSKFRRALRKEDQLLFDEMWRAPKIHL